MSLFIPFLTVDVHKIHKTDNILVNYQVFTYVILLHHILNILKYLTAYYPRHFKGKPLEKKNQYKASLLPLVYDF